MSELDKEILIAIKQAIVRQVKSTDFIKIKYEDKPALPKRFMEDIWDLVDPHKIKQELARRLEEEVVTRIMNAMATELTTDIKSILSVPERRESIRELARANINKLTKS